MADSKGNSAASPVQQLLELLVEVHDRPGDPIDWDRVQRLWNAAGISRPEDLKTARDFVTAPANGLVELKGGQQALTAKGYAQGGGLPVQSTRWAEDIVEILVAFFHERDGDGFTLQELRDQWQKNRDHRPQDLDAGLDYGVQQGWFAKVDAENYTLTAKGRNQFW